jgi:hypothetical protein
MDSNLRSSVRARAENRCEYCQLHQDDAPFARFHVEHIIPRQHGGSDEPENLALACHRCNLKKGPNLTGIDATTGEIAPLYHPRRQKWAEHLRFDDAYIVGLTATGRVTVQVLDMNATGRVELRRALRGM